MSKHLVVSGYRIYYSIEARRNIYSGVILISLSMEGRWVGSGLQLFGFGSI
jgi:hypothetical protein